jgi:hypothetical protein
MTAWWASSLDPSGLHHAVFRNPDIDACKQEGRFCGHFSRVVVSDFRSLRRDIVFRSLLARQSPTAKIPFQTYCAPLAVMFSQAAFPQKRRDRLMITTVTRCWFGRCHSLRLLAAHVVASSVNLSVKRFCWSSSTLPIFAFIWFPISGRLSRRFRIRAFSGKLSDLIRKSACRI